MLSPPQAFLPRTLSGSQIHTPTPRRSRPARAQCHPLTTRRRCSPQVRGSWGPAQGFLPPIFLLASELPGSFLLFYLSFLSNLLQKKRKRKRKKAHEPPGSQRPASVMTAPDRSRFICALPGDPSKRPDAWAPPQPGESESCGSQSSQTFGNRHDEPGTASGPRRVTQHSSPDITPGSQDPDL